MAGVEHYPPILKLTFLINIGMTYFRFLWPNISKLSLLFDVIILSAVNNIWPNLIKFTILSLELSTIYFLTDQFKHNRNSKSKG